MEEEKIQEILKESHFTPLQEQLLRFAFDIEDNLTCQYPTPETHIVRGDWNHKILMAAKQDLIDLGLVKEVNFG